MSTIARIKDMKLTNTDFNFLRTVFDRYVELENQFISHLVVSYVSMVADNDKIQLIGYYNNSGTRVNTLYTMKIINIPRIILESENWDALLQGYIIGLRTGKMGKGEDD